MRIKIEIKKIKTIFWLKGKIEKKNQFNKRLKKTFKIIWIKLEKKKIFKKLGLDDEIENK